LYNRENRSHLPPVVENREEARDARGRENAREKQRERERERERERQGEGEGKGENDGAIERGEEKVVRGEAVV
jgi:hypothetical protein